MSEPSRPIPKKKPNPYLGFGWLGWVGVVVFVALAIAAFRGWDPVYQAMWVVAFPLGWSVSHAAVVFSITWIWWINLTLSPVNGLMIAAVFVWASRRGAAKLGWSIVLGAMSLVLPLVWYATLVGGSGRTRIGPFSRGDWYDGVWIVGCLIPVAICYVATRSGWLSLTWAFMLILSWYEKLLPLPSIPARTPGQWDALWYSWNLLFVGINLLWAIRAVRNAPGENQCPTCHYDLTNLPSTTCPECGGDVSAVVATSTATGRSVGGQNV